MGFAAPQPSYVRLMRLLQPTPCNRCYPCYQAPRPLLAAFNTKEADMRKVRDLQDLPSFQHFA